MVTRVAFFGYNQVKYECPNCHLKQKSSEFYPKVGENNYNEINTCNNCGKRYRSIFKIVYLNGYTPNTVSGYSELM